jgi:4-amino-4-deoxy-L-arabinose transferase-like glycosyltransferase
MRGTGENPRRDPSGHAGERGLVLSVAVHLKNAYNWFKKYYAWLLIVSFLTIYLTPLGTHRLFEPDEGRYAEIPREMIESGDFVTPRLNYVTYFEKPVLTYWMSAAAFKTFGEGEFAARLPSALCALLGIAAVWWLGARVLGRRAGVLSALVLGTSLLYFAIGTTALTDMPVSAFITAALAAFYVGAVSRDRRWYLIFYAAMGAGVLTKGLIGVILPAGVIFWFVLFANKWRLVPHVLYAPGILLFLAISIPWFYLVCKANPDFFRFFFIQEHFLRYATNMHDRYQPFWYFIPLLPAAVMPWTGLLPTLFSKGGVLRSPASPKDVDAVVFFIVWFAVIFIFFSMSGSKLIPYIVPCLPPMALLLAMNVDRMAGRGRWTGRDLACVVTVQGLFAAALFAFALSGKYLARGEAMLTAALVSGGLVAGSSSALARWVKARDLHGALSALCIGALLFALGLQSIYAPLENMRSAFAVAQTAITNKMDGERIAVYGEILHGVPFYAKERVVLVNAPGELEYGASQMEEDERAEWFPDSGEFLRRWDSGSPFALIIDKKYLGSLFEGGIDSGAKTIDAGDHLIIFNRKDG